jgi:hypothetical protein
VSLVKISGNASGTGTLTIAAPNTNTDYTLTLPQATTTIVGTDATQTLTNKTINGGALQSATSQASTSGTSIDFTGIPSWVKRITVMFSGVSTSGTSLFLVQLGDAGGFEITGYASQANSITTTPAVTATTNTAGFVLGASALVAASTYSGTTSIVKLDGNSWVYSSLIIRDGTASSNFGSGSKTLSDTLTQVRITTVNGTDTFDAGTINILFE